MSRPPTCAGVNVAQKDEVAESFVPTEVGMAGKVKCAHGAVTLRHARVGQDSLLARLSRPHVYIVGGGMPVGPHYDTTHCAPSRVSFSENRTRSTISKDDSNLHYCT